MSPGDLLLRERYPQWMSHFPGEDIGHSPGMNGYSCIDPGDVLLVITEDHDTGELLVLTDKQYVGWVHPAGQRLISQEYLLRDEAHKTMHDL